jgi:hypothetical protein
MSIEAGFCNQYANSAFVCHMSAFNPEVRSEIFRFHDTARHTLAETQKTALLSRGILNLIEQGENECD